MVWSGPAFHIASSNILDIVPVKVSSHVSHWGRYMDQIGVLKRTIKIHVLLLSNFEVAQIFF